MSERPNTSPTHSEADRLAVSVRRVEEAGIVLLSGELDPDTAPALALATSSLTDAGVTRIVVDCSQLGFCDSSGLNVLLKARQQVSDVGGRLILAAPTRQLLRLLELTGALSVFETQPEAGGAVAEA
ncbi:STAS domain-containing protein [Streptacidiphilus anmyonensis]|uniref:STAS domain-containing protein n=1 Tax=Streptacidiphilus anmyonensis TaxID=405782 RepID=UPI000694706C|nr:STAS domain-containing protein [Streptacidiphilus anmyonensis]